MIRYFCDGCGKQIGRNFVSQRFKPCKYFAPAEAPAVNFEAEIIVKTNGCANDGHICKDCLIALVTKPECEGRS